jgi:hypothetical protein
MKGRGDLLIIFMFDSKDGRRKEVRDFNYKYVWFMIREMIKLN